MLPSGSNSPSRAASSGHTGWKLLLAFFLMLPSCFKLDTSAPLDAHKLSQEIFRLTNAMRAEKNLPALERATSLDKLSELQSRNMAERNFFDHVDPDGNSPQARMAKWLPGLLSENSGENIALRSVEGDEIKMAGILTELWRNSPEHYKNIMTPEFRNLGVGVEQRDDKLWATQTFASGIAMLDSPPGKVAPGTVVTLRFHFLAGFPSSELTAFLFAPDGTARIPTGTGGAYIGKGPLHPSWTDAEHFELTIPANYGLGVYKIKLGHGDAFYDKSFQFEAVSN